MIVTIKRRKAVPESKGSTEAVKKRNVNDGEEGSMQCRCVGWLLMRLREKGCRREITKWALMDIILSPCKRENAEVLEEKRVTVIRIYM